MLFVFNAYPTYTLSSAIEWGFLYRRYMVLEHQDDESVELDPFSNENSYLYHNIYILMALFVAWFLLMGLKCNRFAPCWSRDAQLKKIVPLRLDEMPDAKTITKDILKEKNLAA